MGKRPVELEFIQNSVRSRWPGLKEYNPGADVRWSMAHDYEASNLGDFEIRINPACHLGYTNPIPSEASAFLLYEKRTSADFLVAKEGFINRIQDYQARSLLAKITRGKAVHSVLDYSTGNGRYALAAICVFPSARVVATDFHAAPPPTLLGTPIQYQMLEGPARTVAGTFDLVLLRHVLEHSYHPVDLLRMLTQNLNPGGVLYIEVPNLYSGCAKVFGKYWTLYYVPYHVFHFTPFSLARLLSEAGLEGRIGKIGMPKMGNTLAAMTGWSRDNLWVKLIGIGLHPLQVLIETLHRSSECLNVAARLKGR